MGEYELRRGRQESREMCSFFLAKTVYIEMCLMMKGIILEEKGM
jgi:hypothetical protein